MTEDGHVESVRKDYEVRADGAFAYRLQETEIEEYYSDNVRRNRGLREDVQVAKRLQDEEDKLSSSATRQLEHTDRKIAEAVHLELVKQISVEEDHRIQSDMAFAKDLVRRESQKALEMTDEEYARQLQKKEQQKLERKKQREQQKQQEELMRQQMAAMQFEDGKQDSTPPATGLPVGVGAVVELPPYSPYAGEAGGDDSRLAQEAHDAEFARTIDSQEDLDRKMAIEQQDEELARHLQEKEKQKAMKRQQKIAQQREEMLKQQQQQGVQQPKNEPCPVSTVQQPAQARYQAPQERQETHGVRPQGVQGQAASLPQLNLGSKQSLPRNNQPPQESRDTSVSTRSAASTTATSPASQDDPDSPLFSYNSALPGQRTAMATDSKVPVRQNYKRQSTKKK